MSERVNLDKAEQELAEKEQQAEVLDAKGRALVRVTDHRAVSAPHEPEPAQLDVRDNSAGALVRLALERDLDLDKLEKLLQLKREEEADQARKAYAEAKAAFAAEAPTVLKDKHVDQGQGRPQYNHATIGNVIDTVGPALARHGFTWDWDLDQSAPPAIKVTCILTHEMGHTEKRSITAPPDKGPGRNDIQAIASTISYLERYTFLAVTGCATRDQRDTDGRIDRPGETEQPEPEPNKRARTALDKYRQYLGKDAQGLTEAFVKKPVAQWGDPEVDQLVAAWRVLKECAPDADKETKRDALLSRLKTREPGEEG